MCYLMCVFLNSIRIPLLNLIRIRSRLLNCSLPETSKYFVRRHASDLNPPHCRKTPLNKLKIFFYFILIYIQYILLYTYITNILLGRVKQGPWYSCTLSWAVVLGPDPSYILCPAYKKNLCNFSSRGALSTYHGLFSTFTLVAWKAKFNKYSEQAARRIQSTCVCVCTLHWSCW